MEAKTRGLERGINARAQTWAADAPQCKAQDIEGDAEDGDVGGDVEVAHGVEEAARVDGAAEGDGKGGEGELERV